MQSNKEISNRELLDALGARFRQAYKHAPTPEIAYELIKNKAARLREQNFPKLVTDEECISIICEKKGWTKEAAREYWLSKTDKEKAGTRGLIEKNYFGDVRELRKMCEKGETFVELCMGESNIDFHVQGFSPFSFCLEELYYRERENLKKSVAKKNEGALTKNEDLRKKKDAFEANRINRHELEGANTAAEKQLAEKFGCQPVRVRDALKELNVDELKRIAEIGHLKGLNNRSTSKEIRDAIVEALDGEGGVSELV